MYHLGRIAETTGDAGAYAGRSEGHVRKTLFGRACGSPHQEVVIAELAAGGSVAEHLHAFEEAFYVLEGELVLEVAGVARGARRRRLRLHRPGRRPLPRERIGSRCRWFELSAPQPGAPLDDTVLHRGRSARGADRDALLARPLRRRRLAGAERVDRPLGLRRGERRPCVAEDPGRPRHRSQPVQPDGRAVRARRLHQGARPRVRRGLLLPRRRGRRRARGQDVHAPGGRLLLEQRRQHARAAEPLGRHRSLARDAGAAAAVPLPGAVRRRLGAVRRGASSSD